MKIISRKNLKISLAFLLLFSVFISNSLSAQIPANIPAQPQDISPLLIGENIPVIKLSDAMGKIFDLNAAISQKPTILIFYRGGWCPYCNKQLSGIQEIEPELKKMGYQIIAISTDSPDNLRSSTEKNKLEYMLLSDADLNASKQFGLAYKAPAAYDKLLPTSSGGKNLDKLLPVPAVFFISKKGNIRFEYIDVDFKQRISADLLRSVAQTIFNEL
ncbi:AhpC/TSA family protein [Niastella caeni]|uniref:thioredoxin-dependent peroxiredoxin n=1 Tax=Niastella caeni TaxID=2569763 RepID=A0A4V4H020_9BACT|nr:peroxiredoxin-like family protein [Niastella caeni]THU34906.1 AhpC/TSA family protein [Niastella caeni]